MHIVNKIRMYCDVMLKTYRLYLSRNN